MYKILYTTESGDEGVYPNTFSQEPTHQQALELVRSWAIWEIENKTSYISNVKIIKTEDKSEYLKKDLEQEIQDQKQAFKNAIGYDFNNLKTM